MRATLPPSSSPAVGSSSIGTDGTTTANYGVDLVNFFTAAVSIGAQSASGNPSLQPATGGNIYNYYNSDTNHATGAAFLDLTCILPARVPRLLPLAARLLTRAPKSLICPAYSVPDSVAQTGVFCFPSGHHGIMEFHYHVGHFSRPRTHRRTICLVTGVCDPGTKNRLCRIICFKISVQIMCNRLSRSIF